MKYLRREATEFIRQRYPVTQRLVEYAVERDREGFLGACVMRLSEELKLSPVSASWDSSQPDRRWKVTA
jgi:hypothetical protein